MNRSGILKLAYRSIMGIYITHLTLTQVRDAVFISSYKKNKKM